MLIPFLLNGIFSLRPGFDEAHATRNRGRCRVVGDMEYLLQVFTCDFV